MLCWTADGVGGGCKGLSVFGCSAGPAHRTLDYFPAAHAGVAEGITQ